MIEISKYLTDYFKLKLASSIHCILNDFLAMKIMKGWNKNGTATTYQKPDDFESFIKAQLSEYEYENSSAATPAIYAWNSQASLWSDTKLKCLFFKKGQNVEVQVFSSLIKNLQFLSEIAQNYRNLSTHGWIKSWKFEQNWTKIVDLLLTVKKICTSTFWPFLTNILYVI